MYPIRSPHYDFEPLGKGVHAAVARLDRDGISNSGLVGLGEGGIVFDTGLTVHAATDLGAAFRSEFHRPPSLVALSHWHLDHSLGSRAFATVPLWGTRRTREILLERKDQLTAEIRREQIEKDIQDLERQREEASSDRAREDLAFILQIHRAILNAAEDAKVVVPDHTFETRLELPGRAGAQLRSFGSGHTEADAVLFLPHEKVLFAGDLVVVGLQPSMGSGDPEHWLEVLDELERLGPERVVPGHGPVSGREGIEETRQYVSGVLEAAQGPETAPLPSPIAKWEGSLSLRENVRFAREWWARRGTH